MKIKVLLLGLCLMITSVVTASLCVLFVYCGYYYLATGDLEYRTGVVFAVIVFVVLNAFYFAGQMMAYRRMHGGWGFVKKI